MRQRPMPLILAARGAIPAVCIGLGGFVGAHASAAGYAKPVDGLALLLSIQALVPLGVPARQTRVQAASTPASPEPAKVTVSEHASIRRTSGHAAVG